MLRSEPNDRDPNVIQAIQPGDFVDVTLNANLQGAFVGFVSAVSSERLRLAVHMTTGNVEVADQRPAEKCLGWDVVFPMSSIAMVRHLKSKPVKCKCRGAAS
jgi:hypothetical protein